MGPQAGAYALKRIIDISSELTAGNNSDYPRITYLSINAEDFIAAPDKKEAALAYIQTCLADIHMASVTDGFIACNTAHLLFDEIQASLPFELTSLIDVAARYITRERTPRDTHVKLLATPTTIASGIYKPQDQDEYVITPPPATTMNSLENIIRNAIKGENIADLSQDLQKIITEQLTTEDSRVLLGCTELSMIAENIQDPRIIDPLELTIQQILRGGQRDKTSPTNRNR